MRNIKNGLIMKITGFIVISFSIVCSTAACSDDPVAVANPEPAVTVVKVPNGSFEENAAETASPKGWTVSGDYSAAKVVQGGCEGNYALHYRATSSYTVSTRQTVNGLEDGFYDLEFYYKSTGGQISCYVAAGTDTKKMTSLQASPSTWVRSYVRGIKVENGKCDIEIHSESAEANWSRFDGLRLKKTEKEFNLLKGGEISQLTYVEQMGGKFSENGEEKDCIEILKNNGFNIVRLRLYNDPGNPDYSPSNRLPAGISGPEDILRLAKRAKQAGMQILLTFHYSDYWTNGEDQNKPHEWEGLDFEGLKKALYDFTFDFMNKMKAQGTTPEFVALGNETQAGMLYPDGSCDNFVQLSELFNTGYDAVKAVSPDSKVVIHSNAAGDKDQYNWYYGELKNRNTKYDIIGASYYPFWTEKTAGQIREWADYITAKFDKDILIMETGYSWDKTLPDNTPGQLAHNGPYPDFSPLGQKNFMLELIKEIKQAKDCRILGFLYWDPIFIEVEGMGWELGAKNYVSNTTLFDFEGNRLEALDAFKYNN
jgi:arabinogalactan endo-1,4-beta-galactosidase